MRFPFNFATVLLSSFLANPLFADQPTRDDEIEAVFSLSLPVCTDGDQSVYCTDKVVQGAKAALVIKVATALASLEKPRRRMIVSPFHSSNPYGVLGVCDDADCVLDVLGRVSKSFDAAGLKEHPSAEKILGDLDCSSSLTRAETAICSDIRPFRVSGYYKKVKSLEARAEKAAEGSDILAELDFENWRKATHDDCGPDPACLFDAYSKRGNELQEWITAVPKRVRDLKMAASTKTAPVSDIAPTDEERTMDVTTGDATSPTVNSDLPPLQRGQAKAEALLGAINSQLQSGSLAPYRISSCQWAITKPGGGDAGANGYQSVLTCFLYPLSRPEFESRNPAPFITVELDGPDLAIGHSGFAVRLGVDRIEENLIFNLRSSREFMVAALSAVTTQYSLNSSDLEVSELTAPELAHFSNSARFEATLLISKLDDPDQEAKREHELRIGQDFLIRVTKFPIQDIWPDLQLVVTKTK